MAEDGKQAFQVVNVVASRHRSTESIRWPVTMEGEERSAVNGSKAEATTIECVFIDFDGQQMGPVKVAFPIRKFAGQREILSLPIYPFRFFVMKDQLSLHLPKLEVGKHERGKAAKTRVSELQQRLIQRGRKFVRVAKIKHMYYAGVTVNPHDEVESPVMVDCEEAFIAKPHWCKNINGLIGGTTSNNTLAFGAEQDDRACTSECCRGENVHDDSYIQEKLHQDFINKGIEELQQNHGKLPSLAVYPRAIKSVEMWEHDLKDEELIIMSYSVFGFILRDRTWGKL